MACHPALRRIPVAMSLPRRGGDDRVQRRLRAAVAVERQRALAGAPGAAVVQAPERDAIDRVAVLDEEPNSLPYASAWAWSARCGRRRRPPRPPPPSWPPPAPVSVTSSSVIATFSFSAL